MHCITVKQPWATLLVAGFSCYLVRDWRTGHRGKLAIQAGAKFPRANIELCCDPEMRRLLRQCGYDFAMELPVQAVVGTVHVMDCWNITDETKSFVDPADPSMVFGQIRINRWCWVCARSEVLRAPIPMPGRLGIFKIPDVLVP